MRKLFSRSKKAVVSTGFVVVGVLSPVMAQDVTFTLPSLDLAPLMTWIVGISGTIIAISATIFAVRKANRFLGG